MCEQSSKLLSEYPRERGESESGDPEELKRCGISPSIFRVNTILHCAKDLRKVKVGKCPTTITQTMDPKRGIPGSGDPERRKGKSKHQKDKSHDSVHEKPVGNAHQGGDIALALTKQSSLKIQKSPEASKEDDFDLGHRMKRKT
uniref:Death-associated protein 1 n=1 Tax=Loa loa TaxID=7209 RepID=A0A1I7VDX7_LOALO